LSDLARQDVARSDVARSDLTRTPARPPRRAAYILPSLFTAGNIFLGFLALLRTIQAAMIFPGHAQESAEQFALAAKVIGFSVLLDGVDGRVARLTHTTSAFGAELDSLADVISFGIAPAVLAYFWGVQFVSSVASPFALEQIQSLGKLVAFLFLLCGAARLARFNVQKNPQPKNPGRPDRKYFVGLAIPCGAGMVAAVVYFCDGRPIESWYFSLVWLALTGALSFLMVSTWRYYSFKDLNLLHPRSPLTVILLGALIILIFYFSQPVLLIMATSYALSGVVIRAGGIIRRLRAAPRRTAEHSIG
jgi:CDP-diacylglycerol---serine O-phosphatidyltransferase